MDFFSHSNAPHVLTQGLLGKILPSPTPSCLFLIFCSLLLLSLPCIPCMTFTFHLLFSQVLSLMDYPSISPPSSLSSPFFSLHSAPLSRSAYPFIFLALIVDIAWKFQISPISPSVSLTSSLPYICPFHSIALSIFLSLYKLPLSLPLSLPLRIC